MIPHCSSHLYFSNNEWCWASFHGFIGHLYVFFGESYTVGSPSWQPTPVFLPGESQGRWSLVGCHLWGSHRVRHDWSDLAVAAVFAYGLSNLVPPLIILSLLYIVFIISYLSWNIPLSLPVFSLEPQWSVFFTASGHLSKFLALPIALVWHKCTP